MEFCQSEKVGTLGTPPTGMHSCFSIIFVVYHCPLPTRVWYIKILLGTHPGQWKATLGGPDQI